jgi:hypothetical protein
MLPQGERNLVVEGVALHLLEGGARRVEAWWWIGCLRQLSGTRVGTAGRLFGLADGPPHPGADSRADMLLGVDDP